MRKPLALVVGAAILAGCEVPEQDPYEHLYSEAAFETSSDTSQGAPTDAPGTIETFRPSDAWGGSNRCRHYDHLLPGSDPIQWDYLCQIIEGVRRFEPDARVMQGFIDNDELTPPDDEYAFTIISEGEHRFITAGEEGFRVVEGPELPNDFYDHLVDIGIQLPQTQPL